MSSFKELSFDGVCAVCGKETDVVACASSMGAISFAYCEDCLNKGLEPYNAMVDYIACAGRFPDDINAAYQEHCRNICRELNISEEKFIADVDKSMLDMCESYVQQYEGFYKEDFFD
jgi:hypothetical protein